MFTAVNQSFCPLDTISMAYLDWAAERSVSKPASEPAWEQSLFSSSHHRHHLVSESAWKQSLFSLHHHPAEIAGAMAFVLLIIASIAVLLRYRVPKRTISKQDLPPAAADAIDLGASLAKLREIERSLKIQTALVNYNTNSLRRKAPPRTFSENILGCLLLCTVIAALCCAFSLLSDMQEKQAMMHQQQKERFAMHREGWKPVFEKQKQQQQHHHAGSMPHATTSKAMNLPFALMLAENKSVLLRTRFGQVLKLIMPSMDKADDTATKKDENASTAFNCTCNVTRCEVPPPPVAPPPTMSIFDKLCLVATIGTVAWAFSKNK